MKYWILTNREGPLTVHTTRQDAIHTKQELEKEGIYFTRGALVIEEVIPASHRVHYLIGLALGYTTLLAIFFVLGYVISEVIKRL